MPIKLADVIGKTKPRAQPRPRKKVKREPMTIIATPTQIAAVFQQPFEPSANVFDYVKPTEVTSMGDYLALAEQVHAIAMGWAL